MARVGVSRSRVPDLVGRCDPLVERAIRDLYLRFYKQNSNVTQIVNQPVVATPLKKSAGNTATVNAYTIVFTLDDLAETGFETPSFTVNPKRNAFAPFICSLTAETAPSDADLKVNFFLDGAQLLTDDLTLPIGQLGPVTSATFAIPGRVSTGQKFRMKIIQSGSAAQVVGEIVMNK